MELKEGDYVLATKYVDGDAGDHFCAGFYSGKYDSGSTIRYLVKDKDGRSFRSNGFRRVAVISKARGAWIVRNLYMIERLKDRYSVWHWYRAPWKELHIIERYV